MALSIATLSGFPAANTTFASNKVPSFYPTGVAVTGTSSPSPTVAATYSFTTSTTFPTNGKLVYTQGTTQYVAGIIDSNGVVPARIFTANNGSGYNQGTQPLPTLNYIIQQTVVDPYGITEYGGYTVVLNPAEPGPDSGSPSSTGALTVQGNPGTPTNYPAEPILDSVPGYTSATPSSGYPQPQIVFYVSMAALLILASTQYG